MAKAKEVVVKRSPQELAVRREQLAARAKAQSATETAASQWVSLKNGRITVNGGVLPSNKMNVVVLSSAHENAYYEGKYDPENRASPVCFSLSLDGKDMKPDAASTKPQSTSCALCKWNAFGTSDNGKGKACKQPRRLALVSADDLKSKGAMEAPIMMLRVPVTSTKNWAGYMKSITEVKALPTACVATGIEVTPDDKTQFTVSFHYLDDLPDAAADAMLAREEDAQKSLLAPFSKYEEAAEKAPSKRAGKKAKY